ncbi:MAG: Smr/MutS family protein [Myxococcota bacterium]
MGRRKKRKRPAKEAEPAAAGAPTRLNRPFAEALRGLRAEEQSGQGRRSSDPHTLPPPGPAPPEPVPSSPPAPAPDPKERREPSTDPRHSYEDRVAFAQAFADVQPLPARRGSAGRRRPLRAPADPAFAPASAEAQAQARARLDALVGGGVRFRLERDEGWVEALREGAPKEALRRLRRPGVAAEARIDLHGMAAAEAEQALRRFVRDRHREGRRTLLVVVGKGQHSEGGVGVLGDLAVEVLTEGVAAPLVEAFATAPAHLGGSGALLVQLVAK